MDDVLRKFSGFKKARDMMDWMLAIDFDPMEVALSRYAELDGYVQVIDKNSLSLKKGY
jgi:hypothetical protein